MVSMRKREMSDVLDGVIRPWVDRVDVTSRSNNDITNDIKEHWAQVRCEVNSWLGPRLTDNEIGGSTRGDIGDLGDDGFTHSD